MRHLTLNIGLIIISNACDGFPIVFQVTGFHQGILRLAMEPTLLLGAALMEGGSDRKIELVCGPRDDEVNLWLHN